jgi:hypothetical protein
MIVLPIGSAQTSERDAVAAAWSRNQRPGTISFGLSASGFSPPVAQSINSTV